MTVRQPMQLNLRPMIASRSSDKARLALQLGSNPPTKGASETKISFSSSFLLHCAQKGCVRRHSLNSLQSLFDLPKSFLPSYFVVLARQKRHLSIFFPALQVFLCPHRQRKASKPQRIQNSVFTSDPASFEEQHLTRTIDPGRLDLRRFPPLPAEDPLLTRPEDPTVFAPEVHRPAGRTSVYPTGEENPSFSSPVPSTTPPQQEFAFAPVSGAPHSFGDEPPLPDPSFSCNSCLKTFTTQGQLNTHNKSHTIPFKCTILPCDSEGFQYKKGLNRHIASKHRRFVPTAPRYHCPHPSCKYSIGGMKDGFSRADNYRRHMRQHGKS
ncbi:hypothetical protein G7Y89_g10396 [Cudoniella acicularis]|uniref:C2H2-type domain-containing protein n=1 Tax=Cudoniella acicularis TaxID=354080 RepID=A0A8H4VZ34_9HELO|nr:hypothetical protein G7Y89_g10396 [Cudoniella acicularis]